MDISNKKYARSKFYEMSKEKARHDEFCQFVYDELYSSNEMFTVDDSNVMQSFERKINAGMNIVPKQYYEYRLICNNTIPVLIKYSNSRKEGISELTFPLVADSNARNVLLKIHGIRDLADKLSYNDIKLGNKPWKHYNK